MITNDQLDRGVVLLEDVEPEFEDQRAFDRMVELVSNLELSAAIFQLDTVFIKAVQAKVKTILVKDETMLFLVHTRFPALNHLIFSPTTLDLFEHYRVMRHYGMNGVRRVSYHPEAVLDFTWIDLGVMFIDVSIRVKHQLLVHDDVFMRHDFSCFSVVCDTFMGNLDLCRAKTLQIFTTEYCPGIMKGLSPLTTSFGLTFPKRGFLTKFFLPSSFIKTLMTFTGLETLVFRGCTEDFIDIMHYNRSVETLGIPSNLSKHVVSEMLGTDQRLVRLMGDINCDNVLVPSTNTTLCDSNLSDQPVLERNRRLRKFTRLATAMATVCPEVIEPHNALEERVWQELPKHSLVPLEVGLGILRDLENMT